MRIASGYDATGSIFEISPSQRACRLPARGTHTSCDTVSISEEARVASATSLQNSGAAARFRKQFAAYRGNGIFADSESAPGDVSGATPEEDAPAAGAEKASQKASELERKIRDLSAQLEAVMESGMPETEKNAMSTRISKEIEELQSQLTAYRQAEKALPET